MNPFYKWAHMQIPSWSLSLCVRGFHPRTPAETLCAWLLEDNGVCRDKSALGIQWFSWILSLQDPGIPWLKVGGGQPCVCQGTGEHRGGWHSSTCVLSSVRLPPYNQPSGQARDRNDIWNRVQSQHLSFSFGCVCFRLQIPPMASSTSSATLKRAGHCQGLSMKNHQLAS